MVVGTDDNPIFQGTDSPKTLLAQKKANTLKGANGEIENLHDILPK